MSMSDAAGDVLNALTIDVEEHFQVHNLESAVPREVWDEQPSRVVPNTRRILELLSEHDTRATFFILGWVADRHPALVREIAEGGHELATHGYAHELIYRQTPEVFEADVARSLAAIRRAFEEVDQEAPLLAGYRAPSFSIVRESLWALDVLDGLGLDYDSSIFPLEGHPRYGIPEASRFASQHGNGLWEFPVSTVRLFGRNMPVAGGGYFRLYPSWVTERAIRRINREGQPAVIYLHPWEFDPDQPRIKGASALSRFRHYVNLTTTAPKLERLLRRGIRLGSMQSVFEAQLAA